MVSESSTLLSNQKLKLLEIFAVGDIEDDEELLDWLTDPTNMEMTDHIERVNRKMFEKIRQTSDYVAVFFCKFIF